MISCPKKDGLSDNLTNFQLRLSNMFQSSLSTSKEKPWKVQAGTFLTNYHKTTLFPNLFQQIRFTLHWGTIFLTTFDNCWDNHKTLNTSQVLDFGYFHFIYLDRTVFILIFLHSIQNQICIVVIFFLFFRLQFTYCKVGKDYHFITIVYRSNRENKSL